MPAQGLQRYIRTPDFAGFRRYIRALPTQTLLGLGSAFSAFITLWYAMRPRVPKLQADLYRQSVEVPGTGGARRSALLEGEELLGYLYENVRTVHESFQRGVRISNNGPCLGSRKPGQPYQWLSYRQVAELSECVGSALVHKGFKASPDQYIGIFSQNRPEWVVVEYGCFAYSMVPVPLYDTLGRETLIHIINVAELTLVFVDKPAKASLLLESVENTSTPGLKIIVVMDSYESDLSERGSKCGVEIISLKAMEDLGRANRKNPMPPAPEDLAVVCFTSGTTGHPKGAMITHSNIVSDFSGFLKVTESVIELNASDTLISFLPLAHMYEQLLECAILCHGARIGFFQGDLKLLMDDLKVLQPTIFPVVPRLLNRMFDRILGQANSTMKRLILDFASKRKQAEVRNGIVRNNSLWDKLVFRKVQSSLGGKVRLMITGAAPVSAKVLTFMRAAMGCQFYEGYGQTECTACCSLTIPGEWAAGHVGAPVPCNMIKLIDVKDMNYLSANGEGEVCVKGPNVFQGYLKDPVKTNEALDRDGWLHTGDIGKWLPNGTLKIIDRKKHIFKLAQGEYIVPEKIENIYLRSEPVAQVFVHGDSLEEFLVAVVVPDVDVLGRWARKRGVVGTFEELCRCKQVNKAILEDLLRLGKESGLNSLEQVKGIVLHPEPFSIENGLLTPTMKAKRPELRGYFKSQIEELYSTLKSEGGEMAKTNQPPLPSSSPGDVTTQA